MKTEPDNFQKTQAAEQARMVTEAQRHPGRLTPWELGYLSELAHRLKLGIPLERHHAARLRGIHEKCR